MSQKASMINPADGSTVGFFGKFVNFITTGSARIKIGGPTAIPAFIGKCLVPEIQKLPAPGNWVNYMMVIRPQPGKTNIFDFRVVDIWEPGEKGARVIISDYSFLDAYPEKIKVEGWFNSRTHQVSIVSRQPAENAGGKSAV
jgi:hypothetical protein